MKYLSVTETARLLGISRQAVLSLVKRGKLPAHKIGNAWAVDRAEVEKRKALYPKAAPRVTNWLPGDIDSTST